jgi:hypothetical protein
MNKIILLLICISNICFGLDEHYFKERYHDLEKTLQIARLYRHHALPTDQQREELLTSFYQTLPSYNSNRSLDEAVAQFVQEQLQSDLAPYHIIPLANTPLAGHSVDPVYFVTDDHDRLQLIVKAFMTPDALKGKFLKEIASLDFIHTNPDMLVDAPYPLAIGKVELQEANYGLLAQSPAKGLRIDALIKNYQNAQGDQTSIAFKHLSEAFHTASQAIAQLR